MIKNKDYDEHESSNATSQGGLQIISDNDNLDAAIYQLYTM